MEKLKDNIILYALVKYGFHFLLFLAFLLTAYSLYPVFQHFIIDTFSKIKYHGTEESWFFLIFIYAIVCQGLDFSIVRRYGLKGYTIVYLVPLGICCLFMANLVMVFYTNIAFAKAGWADLDLLTNFVVVAAVVVLKNRLVERYLKHSQKKAIMNEESPA